MSAKLRLLAGTTPDTLLSVVAQASGKTATIRIYDKIGKITAEMVGQAVAAAEADDSVERIKARINTAGGSTLEGMGIYSVLAQAAKPVDTCVDGVAASMGSVIAQAGGANGLGGKRTIARNGRLMIHGASLKSGATSDPEDENVQNMVAELNASMLDTYAARCTTPKAEIEGWMTSGKDKWFSAKQAKAAGLVDEIYDNGLPALKASIAAELVAEAQGHITDPTEEDNMADIAELEAKLKETETATAKEKQAREAAEARVLELEGSLKESRSVAAKQLVATAVAEGKIKAEAVPTWEAKAIEDMEGTSSLLESIEAKAPAPTKKDLPKSAAEGACNIASERARLNKGQ